MTDGKKRPSVLRRWAIGRAVYTCTQMRVQRDPGKARRGPVIPVPKGKARVTIRLDEEVLAWFRQQVDDAGGGNYQTLINDALRQHIARPREPLEETLRRVIREEMRRAS